MRLLTHCCPIGPSLSTTVRHIWAGDYPNSRVCHDLVISVVSVTSVVTWCSILYLCHQSKHFSRGGMHTVLEMQAVKRLKMGSKKCFLNTHVALYPFPITFHICLAWINERHKKERWEACIQQDLSISEWRFSSHIGAGHSWNHICPQRGSQPREAQGKHTVCVQSTVGERSWASIA